MKNPSRARFFAALAALATANLGAYALVRGVTGALGDAALPPATREGTTVMVAAFVAVTCLAAFIAIDFARRITSGALRDRIAVLLASAAIFGTALAHPPLSSADNAWNLLMGRAWAVHGQNPYLLPASAFATDPAFGAVSPAWHAWSAVYGPLWTMLSAVPAYLATTPDGQRLALRILCAMGYLAAGLILRAGLRRRRPADAETLFAFWLLNPVAAFEIANAGHNEGVLLPFLALAAVGAAEGGLALATAGIVGAALVKVWPLALLPALVGMKAGVKKKIAVAVASTVAFLGTWSVFWDGPATLAALTRHASSAGATYFYAPFRFAAWAAASILRIPDAVGIAHAAALLVTLAVITLVAAKAARGRMTPLFAILAIMAAYHGIWLNWLQPWHLLAFAPFIALAVPAERAIALITLLGMVGLSFYAVPPWFVAGGIAAFALVTYARGKRKKSA